MKITSFFSKINNNNGKNRETFLALEINNETVKAAVWSVINNQVEVLRLGSIEEWEKEEEILAAADASVTSALEGISPEPNKVIFGLPEDWVEGEAIISSKKKILSLLCEKLDLKPVGFVVSLEALVTYLKLKQGTPVSAIFIRLAETEIVVSLVTLGKIEGSHHVGRSQDLALDIKEGLARFKNKETFPARMILYDGLSDFEEAKQQIISFDWQANLPFLHFPRVDSLERDFVMKAIAIAGGSEVAKSLGFEINHPKESHSEEEEEAVVKDQELEVEESAEAATEETKPLIRDEGQRKDKEEFSSLEEKPFEEKTLEEELAAEEFGFVKDDEIEKKDSLKIRSPMPADGQKEDFNEETNYEEQRMKEKRFPLALLNLPGKLFFFLSRKKLLILLAFLPILIFLFYFLYSKLLKAEISLYFEPKIVEKELAIFLNTESSKVDLEKNLIPAIEIVKEVEGQSDLDVTGEKLTGEKASGKVIIYNKTSTEALLEKGTVLVGPDNLKFLLNEDVKIASKSSEQTGEGEKIVWGKAEAKITASSIGEDSNLPAGSNLSFKDYSQSSLSAKTEEGLSGGSSKKIKVVTSDDRKELLEKLTKELEQKGLEMFKQQASEERIVLDEIIESEVLEKEYNKKVDEEADKLNLNLKLSLKGLSIKKEDLLKLLSLKFKDELAGKYEINASNIEIEILDTEKNGSQFKTTFKVKMRLKPVINSEEIKKNLVGKNIEKAREYLFNTTELKKAKIDIYPSFLGNLKRLPLKSQNITIEIKED